MLIVLSLMCIVVGATNPSCGVIDFNDWRALQPIFDAAKLAGIFITLRPGEHVLQLFHSPTSDLRDIGPYVGRPFDSQSYDPNFRTLDQRGVDRGWYRPLDHQRGRWRTQDERDRLDCCV